MAVEDWQVVKEHVRQATDIVALVERSVPLRRQGRVYVGLCPWHDDSRPSLHVNPERQSFMCFVCQFGGDVFSFVMRQEGVDFRQALEILAEQAGISLSPAKGHKPTAPGSPDDKPTLYQAMAWSVQQFHQCLLHAEEAAAARRYLGERGLEPASIARFQLGYSPERWDWLASRAAQTPYSSQVLERVGLIVPRPSGSGYYDRFRGRLLFPISDVQQRPIALGGRVLPGATGPDVAKYINSPETPLFSKHQQLYGLDAARDAVAKRRNVIVVEGYTDCLAAHQHGWPNAVAVLGTALGAGHIRLLRRYADTITLVLDGDEAGRRRTNEILELFVAAQVDLRILTLPENLDPCDFLRAHGSEAFGRLLAGAVDALQHKIATVTKGLDLTADTHQAHAALEDVLGTLAKAPHNLPGAPTSIQLREHQILTRLARTFGPPEEQLRKRLVELRRQNRRPASAPFVGEAPAEPHQADFWDRMLLETVIGDGAALAEVAAAVEPKDLRSAACREIYVRALELLDAGQPPDFERLMLAVEDPQLKSLLVQLDESRSAKLGQGADSVVRDVITNFRLRKEDDEHGRLTATLRQNNSQEVEKEALDTLMARLKSRQDRSAPTDG